MEDPPSSKRTTAAGRDDVRESVRDGIRVDGKRKHQRVREGGRKGESVGACAFFIRDPYLCFATDDNVIAVA